MSITDEPRKDRGWRHDVKQVMERLRVSKSFAYELITTLLETENAKLQDENARLRSRLSDEFAENARMTVENARLRELVDYMTPLAWYAASERERDRMRELGVEV